MRMDAEERDVKEKRKEKRVQMAANVLRSSPSLEWRPKKNVTVEGVCGYPVVPHSDNARGAFSSTSSSVRVVTTATQQREPP